MIQPNESVLCIHFTANDYDFIAGNVTMTWDEALAWCLIDHGRYLASIHSDYESAVASAVCGENSCWIGSRCYDSDCIDWEWQDTSSWSYTNWYTPSGEPNNVNEKCVEMYSNGYWNDHSCTVSRLPLCGKEGTETLAVSSIVKKHHFSEVFANVLISTLNTL